MGQLQVLSNSSGIPYALITANRQYAIYEKMHQIAVQREPDWRKETHQFESLLALGPNLGLKKRIYDILFSTARNAAELEPMIKYGEQLYALDPRDTAPLARIALEMANKKVDLLKALNYARQAEAALGIHLPKETQGLAPLHRGKRFAQPATIPRCRRCFGDCGWSHGRNVHRGGNNVLFADFHVATFRKFDPTSMTFHPSKPGVSWHDLVNEREQQ